MYSANTCSGVSIRTWVSREAEVQIELGELVLELADRLATPAAPGDAQRIQERQFDRPVLGEQGGGVLAARDGGEEFEQQGLGVFHCDGLSEPGVTAAAPPTRHDIIRSAI
jgi:hypothetical protein